MGFSGDNLKGFLLALLSSGFIGASFIIKKKGLKKAAAASGVRAGIHFSPPVRFLSLCLCVFGHSQFDGDFFFFVLLCLNLIGVGGYAYLLEPLWWLGMITSM